MKKIGMLFLSLVLMVSAFLFVTKLDVRGETNIINGSFESDLFEDDSWTLEEINWDVVSIISSSPEAKYSGENALNYFVEEEADSDQSFILQQAISDLTPGTYQ